MIQQSQSNQSQTATPQSIKTCINVCCACADVNMHQSACAMINALSLCSEMHFWICGKDLSQTPSEQIVAPREITISARRFAQSLGEFAAKPRSHTMASPGSQSEISISDQLLNSKQTQFPFPVLYFLILFQTKNVFLKLTNVLIRKLEPGTFCGRNRK